jgi:hypothetical protein
MQHIASLRIYTLLLAVQVYREDVTVYRLTVDRVSKQVR